MNGVMVPLRNLLLFVVTCNHFVTVTFTSYGSNVTPLLFKSNLPTTANMTMQDNSNADAIYQYVYSYAHTHSWPSSFLPHYENTARLKMCLVTETYFGELIFFR
jgi:hypothetical protein